MSQDLSESQILAKIIDGSPIPSFVINSHHIVTHWNTAIEALTGSKKENMIGTDSHWLNFYDRKRPSLADLIVDGASDELIDLFYQGKCDKSLLLKDAYRAEDFFPSLGQSGKWVQFTASPVRDDEGKTIGAIETILDVTDTRLAQYSLGQSEEKYKDLFENAAEAMCVQDLSGKATLVNKACERLTGFSREELLMMNVKDLLSDNEALALARRVGRRLLAGQEVVQPYEQRLKRKDGSVAVTKMSTTLLVSNGEPSGFQHIARDITDEIRMAQSIRFYLREVLVAQEEERKRIARELHDDTAQLLGSLSRQLDNFIRKRPRRQSGDVLFLKDLQSQLNRGVEEVHRFSQALRLSILDDLGLIPALRSLLKGLKTADGLNVELKLIGEERRFPAEVETMLFRIVQEATENIRKHAHASSASVVMSFGDEALTVSITDNGTGFELTNGVRDLARGGRLGLAGIQERAHLLGGSLKVKSTPGKGTLLTVTVPNSLTGLAEHERLA